MKPSQSIFPMNDQHRATDSEWYCLEARTSGSKADVVAYSCILELRDRIESLEAVRHAHVDLSPLSDAEREQIRKRLASPGRFHVLEAAVDRAASKAFRATSAKVRPSEVATTEAQPNHPAKPDSSLVDRVADAIVAEATSAGIVNDRPARAAIREVAAWLQEKYGRRLATIDLEQEAER